MKAFLLIASLMFLTVGAVQAQIESTESNQPAFLSDQVLLALITSAAHRGDAKSQLILGDAYMLGNGGLGKSTSDAMTWYLKAANQGYTPAQRRLGYWYSKGEGVERDDAIALDWYLRAAESGDAQAQWTVGSMYGVKGDKREAYFWYLLAISKGNKEAIRARDYTEAQLSRQERKAAQARVLRWHSTR